MPNYLNWLSMVPKEYDRAPMLQGAAALGAGLRDIGRQKETQRSNLEREEQARRVQTEQERATAFTEDKSLYDVDVAAFNAQQENVQKQSKEQVAWLKENQDRLRDPISREAALAENAALFPVADQSLQRPTFRGGEEAAPAGTEVVAAEAAPEAKAPQSVEEAVMEALAGQTGVGEGVLGPEQEGYREAGQATAPAGKVRPDMRRFIKDDAPDAPQGSFGVPESLTGPVSSTEQAGLDDFLGRVAGGGQMGPPGMDAMVPTLPANLGVSSDPSQLRSPVQLPDGGPMPPQDIPQSAPAQPMMPPPGMGVGAQPFGPSLGEQDAAAAMQEAIDMGIMPQPPAGTPGPALTRITMANGEELLIDFETPDKASADAIQEVADAIAEGTPDVGRKAAGAIKTMQESLLKANRGDTEKTNKQMVDVFLKLTDYEKSMRNAAQISRSKGDKGNVDFYKLGLSEMNRDLGDTSTFGKTRTVIQDVYKGLQDVQSANPMRKNAALKSMVTAIESRVSDKDMDFAPGDLSIIQRASKWFSTNIGGTMSDEMQHRLEGSLKAIYHDGMKKQRAAYERVQSRINDTTSMWEKKGLMTAANKHFAGYEQTKDRPNGFYTKYRVSGGGNPRGTRSSFRAKGLDPEQMRELETATADEIRGGL